MTSPWCPWSAAPSPSHTPKAFDEMKAIKEHLPSAKLSSALCVTVASALPPAQPNAAHMCYSKAIGLYCLVSR